MLLVYLIVELLIAVFTARMVQKKPCMQLHPEAPTPGSWTLASHTHLLPNVLMAGLYLMMGVSEV